MNRNTLCFCAGMVFCLACQSMAQATSTASIKTTTAKIRKIVVKEYKSFKEYVANEEANLKVTSVTTDNGSVREKLKEMGIHLEEGSLAEMSEDKMAYVSSDKKGVAVVDRFTGTISLYNAEGEPLKVIPMKEFPDGRVEFSRTRVFV